MTQFDLTDDQLQIQEMARKFTADAITPFAAEWDEKHIFPRDTIREAAELGFGAIYVSEESGGIGLGRLEAALIMEAMAYGCPSTSAFISIHNMAAWMIDRFGRRRSRKVPAAMIGMEQIASYCLTEPSSGSDAAALKTKAVLDGDHYVVSGTKAFISGGGENEIYVTMVRTGEEARRASPCLVIEKDMPGVSFGAQEKKLGWHSQPTAQVNFDEVRVPVANRVGAEGEGFRIAMMGLDGGRLNIGACSLGGAQRCLDEAIKYTKDRQQFGTADRRFPGHPVHARRHGDRARGRALAALRRGGQGDRERARQDPVRGDGQAPRDRHRIVGRRPRAAAPRRLRLSAGLSDRALLARPARPFDPRRHQPDHADDRRPGLLAVTAQSILSASCEGVSRLTVTVPRREARDRVGRIRLNRPKAHPRADQRMCEAMSQALLEWRDDPAVEAVIIDHAEGPRLLRRRRHRDAARAAATSDADEAKRFFFAEYRLNHLLFTYPKPTSRSWTGSRWAAASASRCRAIIASRPRTRGSPCPRPGSACSPTSAAAGTCRACPGASGSSWR